MEVGACIWPEPCETGPPLAARAPGFGLPKWFDISWFRRTGGVQGVAPESRLVFLVSIRSAG